jgi:hypothetical protein
VSPHLQKQIIEGKDINLASLLINNYECHQKRSISTESLEATLTLFSRNRTAALEENNL